MKWLRKIKKVNFTAFMQGLTLLIAVILLASIFTILSTIGTVIFNLITLKFQTSINQFGAYMKKTAMAIGYFMNVTCAGSLRFLMVKKSGGHYFGDTNENISYVLGRNKFKGKLKLFGKFIVWILNIIEKNHVQKAISEKIESDQDAVWRCNKNQYYE